ncbi:MAG TPA: hypothetical protein VFE48_08135 [Methylomirabilota bacterium]|nr:hypothetical protein [Methylomirabilota bacterium]
MISVVALSPRRGRGPARRRLALLASALVVLTGLVDPARAGHELPFYPGYYPQEIRLETLTPAAAAAQLRSGSLHAYLGDDPFAGGRLPGSVEAAESLAGYVVLSPATAASGAAADRCGAALRAARALAAVRVPGFVPHPYPVTPYHGDYLEHADLAEAARRAVEAARGAAPRLGAKGTLAERLVKAAASAGPADRKLEWIVEEIDLPALLAARALPVGEVPWSKAGWFQAYLVLAPAMRSPAARQEAEALERRLAAGDSGDAAEHADLARRLVARLGAGCERVVVGYTLRREAFNAEFSKGIENVAWDSQAGFDSPIFVRTAKLKDFPWNGWMRLGIATRPTAAWNPIAGFTDPAGRLLWAALGDPAFLPGPYGGGLVPHRAVPASVTTGGVEIPEDAWLPEPGTGLPRAVGRGRTAKAKIVYRLWASAAHDNTRVSVGDLVYPYVFAARWGTPRARAGVEYDPTVDAATRAARQALAGVRVVKVDSEVRRFSDITFTYVVPVIEVYLNAEASDPQELAALAPPWSPVPWHVTVLMEEAVKQGLGAFSGAEARRRGVRWLDLARDPKTREGLAAIADRLARDPHVPEALRGLVDADEAQNRWTALRLFGQRRGHYLVTNGPYQLDKWSDGAVVLQVFRDMANPLGVGTYDRFAIPRRAYVARITATGERLEITPEIERVERFLRQHRLVREPLGSNADEEKGDVPTARFVIVSADGRVAAAGTSRQVVGHRLVADLKGRLRPGAYTAQVALTLGENLVRPEIATVGFRVEGQP